MWVSMNVYVRVRVNRLVYDGLYVCPMARVLYPKANTVCKVTV